MSFLLKTEEELITLIILKIVDILISRKTDYLEGKIYQKMVFSKLGKSPYRNIFSSHFNSSECMQAKIVNKMYEVATDTNVGCYIHLDSAIYAQR